MDYSHNDEEYNDDLPKRTDNIYNEIENFELYEFTHCVVYEMATRNQLIKRKLNQCNRLRDIREKLTIRYMGKYFGKSEYFQKSEILSTKIKRCTELAVKLTEELIHKYLIYPNSFEIKDTGIENTLLIEKILKNPLSKYSSWQIIDNGVQISQGIYKDKKHFDISTIRLNSKRRIYDTNQTNININMSLPAEELLAHIEHLKRNAKQIKSPNSLLGKDTKEAIRTENYPKNPTAIKLANMFFVYDYVKAKLKEHEYCKHLMEEEYKEKQNNVNKDLFYTRKDKKMQLQLLLEEYEQNRFTTTVEDIFKDFDKPMENINFKGSSASNYYYSLKPYIEECRYSEFLTGESILEDMKDEKDIE